MTLTNIKVPKPFIDEFQIETDKYVRSEEFLNSCFHCSKDFKNYSPRFIIPLCFCTYEEGKYVHDECYETLRENLKEGDSLFECKKCGVRATYKGETLEEKIRIIALSIFKKLWNNVGIIISYHFMFKFFSNVAEILIFFNEEMDIEFFEIFNFKNLCFKRIFRKMIVFILGYSLCSGYFLKYVPEAAQILIALFIIYHSTNERVYIFIFLFETYCLIIRQLINSNECMTKFNFQLRPFNASHIFKRTTQNYLINFAKILFATFFKYFINHFYISFRCKASLIICFMVFNMSFIFYYRRREKPLRSYNVMAAL